MLLVSPPVFLPALRELEDAVENDKRMSKLVDRLRNETRVKENPNGTPSLWYMALISSESFFDGFGFHEARGSKRFPSWQERIPPRRLEIGW